MRVLVVDDDVALCRSLQIHLEREGHSAVKTHSVGEGIDAAREGEYDVAFVDLDLPDGSGLDALRGIEALSTVHYTVMITGIQDAAATIQAIKAGAFEYLRKPLDLDVVLATLRKIEQEIQSKPVETIRPVSEDPQVSDELIGAHPKIIEVLKQVALVSGSRVPVLILGESGTGKELVARSLHHSGSPGLPFVAVNCSAVVSTLLESELFGHVKGAFTSADSDKKGKLEAAGEGVIFFDEIGDMSYDLQAKLLRVIQEKEYEPVGSTKTRPFRGRIVAATHRDLKAMVEHEEFREDLYYRLAVVSITVPPLRERRSDIPLIVDHMLKQLPYELHKNLNGIDDNALKRCLKYDWPGNVRELYNVLTRAVLLARGPLITEDLLAMSMEDQPESREKYDQIKKLREMEKEHVFRALISTGWNIKRTSELLDISRVTLRKKIQDFGLKKPMEAG